MSGDALRWLRERGAKDFEHAKRQAAITRQRARDIAALCDALESHWSHPNTTDEQKARLGGALERLFGRLIDEHIESDEALSEMEDK